MLKWIGLFSVLMMAGQAMAAEECNLTIDSTDAMQYSTDSMTVPASCDEVTVTLTHSGQLPRETMGHNWVLTNTADADAVATAGISVGLDGDYLPADDDRVIAATEIIGGGETTSVTFSTAGLSADGDYTFFCSFPGHNVMMKGSFTIE